MSYDVRELTFSTTLPELTSRWYRQYRAPVHYSLSLGSNMGPLYGNRNHVSIRTFRGRGKQMVVQIGQMRVACTSIVFYAPVSRSSRPKARFVLRQDGRMYFFASRPLRSQPWYYIPTLRKHGPLEVMISYVNVVVRGSRFELSVRTAHRRVTLNVGFQGRDTSMTIRTPYSDVYSDNVLLSLVYPCWNRRRRRSKVYVTTDGRGYVSLFHWWRRLIGRQVILVQVLQD